MKIHTKLFLDISDFLDANIPEDVDERLRIPENELFSVFCFIKKSSFLDLWKFIAFDSCKVAITGFQICNLHKINL